MHDREDVVEMKDSAPARAIVLDLFGTVVDNFSYRVHEQVLAKMAAILGASRADFARWWGERTGPSRLLGAFPTVEANVVHVCAQLGITPDPARVTAAATVTLDFTREALTPRDGVVEALTQARAMGYKLGLISDCSPAVPLLWPETTFSSLIDAPVFSCAERLRKPHPRIYQIACERLNTSAERCVYVGDGSSDELTGATDVGMHAVLFACDYSDSYDAHRAGVADWRGPTIARFEDLLPLLRALPNGS